MAPNQRILILGTKLDAVTDFMHFIFKQDPAFFPTVLLRGSLLRYELCFYNI